MPLELIERIAAFELNPFLAESVIGRQQVGNPVKHPRFKTGQNIINDDRVNETLTEARAAGLNREELDYFLARTDQYELPSDRNRYSTPSIAGAVGSDLQEAVVNNGKAWVKLCEALDWGDTIMIPLFKHPFLAQKNDHPPMARARARLIEMGLPEDYNGAVRLGTDDAQKFIQDMFLNVRFNAGIREILVSTTKSATVSTLCQYINYHFETFEKTEAENLQASFAAAGLHHYTDFQCNEPYSNTGAISGRRIVVSDDHD